MRQTFALLIDAYRELNAKKLFWITLILSGLIVLAIAAIGINREGISVFGWTPGFLTDASFEYMSDEQFDQMRSVFYKGVFDWVGIKIWLTWAAIILAIFSTAGMFPDMIREGAIDLLLTKPISRLRLFLTKYVLGLGFVALQVAVFSIFAFFVIGFRAGDWDLRVFLAIPIVLVFFSYLFAVCVMVGVLTRSTLLAVIATAVVWIAMFGLNISDDLLLGEQADRVMQAQIAEARLEHLKQLPSEADLAREIPENAAEAPDGAAVSRGGVAADREEALEMMGFYGTPYNRESREGYAAYFGDAQSLQEQAQMARESADEFGKWRYYALWVKTPLPKTGETRQLMSRVLADDDEVEPVAFDPAEADDIEFAFNETRMDMISSISRELQKEQRPWTWVVLTSLLFEFAVVGFAAWIFCRRDY